jgi:hypothetical protein
MITKQSTDKKVPAPQKLRPEQLKTVAGGSNQSRSNSGSTFSRSNAPRNNGSQDDAEKTAE